MSFAFINYLPWQKKKKNAKLFVMALIKREILTSREVLYTKSCTRNQFLFAKKMLNNNDDNNNNNNNNNNN